MSAGCLCECGHRTPRHRFLLDGSTPCADCACGGFVHADNDPLCENPNLPKNKSGKVDMLNPAAVLVAAFEPLIGPQSSKDHDEMVEEIKNRPPWQDV